MVQQERYQNLHCDATGPTLMSLSKQRNQELKPNFCFKFFVEMGAEIRPELHNPVASYKCTRSISKSLENLN